MQASADMLKSLIEVWTNLRPLQRLQPVMVYFGSISPLFFKKNSASIEKIVGKVKVVHSLSDDGDHVSIVDAAFLFAEKTRLEDLRQAERDHSLGNNTLGNGDLVFNPNARRYLLQLGKMLKREDDLPKFMRRSWKPLALAKTLMSEEM